MLQISCCVVEYNVVSIRIVFLQFFWKGHRSFNMETDLSNFLPYEEDLESPATEEEAAEQDARMAGELEEELRYQARFDRELDVNTWYELWTVFI